MLPPELIDMILRHFDPELRRGKLSLCACSLVSRSWRAVALPYLFRVFELSLRVASDRPEPHPNRHRALPWRPPERGDPPKTYTTTSEAQLFFEQNASLATNVRVLRLKARQQFRNLHRIPALQLLAFLRLFPNLEDIRLDDILIEAQAPGTRVERFTVQSLEVRLDLPVSYDEEAHSILKCFSAVENATMHMGFTSDTDRTSRPGVLSTKIKSLNVRCVPEGVSVVFARFSRSSMAKTLHTLSVYQLEFTAVPAGLQALLTASQANLSSLTLSFKAVHFEFGGPPIDLSACESLRSLTLVISDGEKDWLKIWPTIATLSSTANVRLESVTLSIRPFGHACSGDAALWAMIDRPTVLRLYQTLRELMDRHRFRRFAIVRGDGREVQDQIFPYILGRHLTHSSVGEGSD